MVTPLYFISAAFLFLYAFAVLVPAIAFLFSRSFKNKDDSTILFFSIILPVRNEQDHIAACLESLRNLDYPKSLFEIILVDDHSNDDTMKIVAQFVGSMDNLILKSNGEDANGKKSAITNGVQQASGKYIVTTDGDCVLPVKWLQNFAQEFERTNATLIAGPVSYRKSFSSLRDLLQIEQLSMQIVSAGFIQMGFPMMCSGANLAYKKEFFQVSGGYKNDPYTSGDDMMLLLKANALAKGQVAFINKRSSIVITQSAKTISETIRQRVRWISKFAAYATRLAGLVGILVFMANFIMPLLALFSIWDPLVLRVLFSAFLLKMLIDVLLLSLTVPFFREPRLLMLAPTGEVFHTLLSLVVTLARWSGSFTWKGRKWKR